MKRQAKLQEKINHEIRFTVRFHCSLSLFAFTVLFHCGIPSRREERSVRPPVSIRCRYFLLAMFFSFASTAVPLKKFALASV
jgi:hypothetical protein